MNNNENLVLKLCWICLTWEIKYNDSFRKILLGKSYEIHWSVSDEETIKNRTN